MKIHLISDLHCDFSEYDYQFPECDFVIIAGDIAEDSVYLENLISRNSDKKIIYVPGNHCYYGSSILSKEKDFKQLELKHQNFKFLQHDWIIEGNVAVFGATLWSNLNAYRDPFYQFQLKNWYPMQVNDCRNINSWSSDLMISEYEDSIKSLKTFLKECKDYKKVGVSHFAPSLLSVHERFKDQIPYNAYWCNNLDFELIDQVSLWCHGHVHNSFDYEIGNCRVVCNPRGYIHPRYGAENSEFNPKLILEV